MEYKITIKSIIQHLFWFIIYSIGFIFMGFFFIYIMEYEYSPTIPTIIIFGGAILLLNAILFFNYFFLNVNMIIVVDPINEELIVKIKEKEYKYRYYEIKLIEQYQTNIFINNDLGWMPWDNYNYSKITFDNDETIYITSLMYSNFKLPLRNGLVKLNRTAFPTTR